MFKQLSVETVEKGSNSVRKINDGSHNIGSKKKRKMLEENPSRKKFGIVGGVLVSESNFESKTDKTHEGGGSGNVKNLLKNLGQRRPFRFSRGPRSCMVVL